MPEKPKREVDEDEKPRDVPDNADESSWERDIEGNDYYYDDAHGYEVFKPDDEAEEDDRE